MQRVLELLEKDSRLTAKELSTMTGLSETEVSDIISKCEADGTIIGYTAIIDSDKTEQESVMALIEVKISPQHGVGFDRIAERIYQYDEVESLYLCSGSFDLAVMMSAKTMRDVAEFVYAHLAAIEGVAATATHFIMKKYKEKNRVFAAPPEQEERVLFI